MSSRTKRHLWWLIFATAITVPNCVGSRRGQDVPVAEPIVVAADRPATRASTPPLNQSNDGLSTGTSRSESRSDDVGPAQGDDVGESVMSQAGALAADSSDVTEDEATRSATVPSIDFERFGQGQLVQPILSIRVEQLDPVTISGLTRDTSLLVPFGLFTDITAVLITDVVQGRSFSGRTGRGRAMDFVIDTDSGVARIGNRRIALDTLNAVWFNDDLYLGLDVLTELLDVRAQMNWTDLMLRVYDAHHLPAVARYERALRRRFFEEIGTIEGAEQLPVISSPLDGAVLDWSLTSFTSDPVQSSIMQLGAGVMVGGGSLDVQYARINSLSINTFDWSWVRAWSGNPYVRQVRVGEIATTGRSRNAILGGSITNAPYVRPAAFAEEILAGEFPEGWEVEVYRGGQLIAFSVVDSTGRFGVNLPVQYGQNPVTLVGYGPRGEVVVRERTFEIPFLRLPAGTFEYGASLGECQITHCRVGQNVDLRYGVTDRLTVQAGSELFLRNGQSALWAPYAIASMALTRSLSVTGEAVLQGLTRARADFAPSPDLRMSFTQTWFDQSNPSALTGSVFETQRTQVFGFYRPGLLGERIFFEARGLRSQGVTRNQDIASLSSTIRFSGSRLTGGVFVDRIEDAVFNSERSGVEASFNSILRGPLPVLRTMFVSANARVDRRTGLTRFGATAGRQILRPLRLDVRAEWDERMGSSLNIELTSILRQMRASSRNQYQRGSVFGTQQVEGSLLWNRPSGRAEFSNGRAMGRAGVTGTVFLDDNLNGVRDPGEMDIPGAKIRVASQIITADSMGHFSAWDLVPFEPALVEVDPMSIDNPLWVPQFARAFFTPTPNTYQLIDIPILQGGEVNGRAVFEDGRPVMGATVLLIHQGTGDTTQTLTFSDGTFYAYGLRPGDYVADLAESVQTRLGGVAASMAFAIKPSEGVLFADDITLIFVRDDR